MKRIETIINHLSTLRSITPTDMLNHRTENAVWCKHVIAWVSIRALKLNPANVASALGYTVSRNIVTYGCRRIDRKIRDQNPYVLQVIHEICQQLNTIPAKTDGTSSHSDWYNTLSEFLPSAHASMLRILGKVSPTGTTATRQPSSVTSSPTKAGSSTTPKADSHTSHTQRGTHSFCFTSDTKWANREALRYDFATPSEQQQLYSVLCAAAAWGRKCAYEHRIRKSKLKDQNIYSSIID